MKFEKLAKGSISAGDLRVRLARLEDQEFIEDMNARAGAQRPSDRVTHTLYQRGIRAALRTPGGYWRTVAEAYNAGVEADLATAFGDAMDAASFDLIAIKDGQRAGSVSIGASSTLAYGLLDHLGEHGQHQILGLIMGLPKLVSITLEDQYRGHGYGADLLHVTQQLMSRMGCVGYFGECADDPGLIGFYQRAGLTVLDPGQHLNAWPIAGDHIVTRRRGNPDDGPFIAAEPGFRIFYGLGGHLDRNDSERALAELNQPGRPNII